MKPVSVMKARRPESGFALLFVFVMAAAIAITLYIEVPRVAFESQRAREQMTIDRALQYQRGIQLFYRKFQLYPQNLDDLETTRNIRFLRHRYKDPLTGKEFRLLHVGPSGQLTDSLIQPANTMASSANNGSGNGPNTAQNSSPTGDPNAPAPADPLNMAARRPSDRIAPTGGGTPVDQQPDPEPEQPQQPDQPQQPEQPPLDPNQPAQPGQLPGQLPGQTGFPGQPGLPGQAGFGGQQPVQDPNQPQNPQQPQFPLQPQFPGQQPQFPGQQPQFPGQQPQFPGQQPQFPGQQPQFPAQQPVFPPQTPTNAPPGQTPLPGQQFPFPQLPQQQAGGRMPGAPGSGGAQQANTAAGLIQSLLTTPRQPPASIAAFTTGNTGGIAGVASTAEGKGIHVVNDRTKYKEWEFVYDIKKDKNVVGAAGVAQQQQVQQQMQQSQQPGTNSPFGNSPFNSGAAPATPTTPPPPVP